MVQKWDYSVYSNTSRRICVLYGSDMTLNMQLHSVKALSIDISGHSFAALLSST
jgi:environmental stress-induced protein Ves